MDSTSETEWPEGDYLTSKRTKKRKPSSVVAIIIACAALVVWSLAALPSSIGSAAGLMRGGGGLSAAIGAMIGSAMFPTIVVFAVGHFAYWRSRTNAREWLYFIVLAALSLLINVGGFMLIHSTAAP